MKFKHTKKALVKYHEKEPLRKTAWESVEVEADVVMAKGLEIEHLNEVRKAFFKDTKGINSLDHCMIASLEHMTACVNLP